MSSKSNLGSLLQNMKPEIQSGVFVFCSLPNGQAIPAEVNPVQVFSEKEGITLITLREEAEKAGLCYQFSSRQITLTVHSSLNAVGFIAAITARLAQEEISVNPVSAFYHDHLFVPDERADDAMRILLAITTQANLS